MRRNSVITVRNYNAGPFRLLLGEYDERLCLCSWIDGKAHAATLSRVRRILGAEVADGESEVLKEATVQLDGYFEGRRRDFDIPLLLSGTEFQKSVWRALRELL